MENSLINVYLVSDASGETVLHIAKAALAQFKGLSANKFLWPMIRSKEQILKLEKIMQKEPGLILYTIVHEETEKALQEMCNHNNFKAISVLGNIIDEISMFLDHKNLRNDPGIQHRILDDEYHKRITATEFTLAHDDGQSQKDINQADIIIIGVSRTSKSPTSLYLAQRGYKTANIPFIKGVGINLDVTNLHETLVVGLTIGAERLRSLREHRLGALTENPEHVYGYVDLREIRQEIIEARQYFQEHNITVIDITESAIEETAARIIGLYTEKFGVVQNKLI